MPTPNPVCTLSIDESNLDTLIAFLVLAEGRMPDAGSQRAIKLLFDQIEVYRPRNNKLDRANAVVALCLVVEDYLERARTWKDISMKKSARDDASDVAYIADLVEAENDSLARSLTANLDTAVREEMPEEAFRFIGLRRAR